MIFYGTTAACSKMSVHYKKLNILTCCSYCFNQKNYTCWRMLWKNFVYVLCLPVVLGLSDCFCFCWFLPSHFWESLPRMCSNPQPCLIFFTGGRCIIFHFWRMWAFCWSEQVTGERGRDPVSHLNVRPMVRLESRRGREHWGPRSAFTVLPVMSPSSPPSWLFLCIQKWAWKWTSTGNPVVLVLSLVFPLQPFIFLGTLTWIISFPLTIFKVGMSPLSQG